MSSTILVAVSDDSIRSLISDILSNMGYGVVQASDALEARAGLNQNRPDVAFVDIDLEGVQPFTEKAEALRVSLFFVVQAGLGDPTELVGSMGAIGYLEKPVRREWLELLARQGVYVHQQLTRELVESSSRAITEIYLQELLKVGDEAVFLLDGEGGLFQVNDAGLSVLVGQPTDMVGKKYLSLLPSLSAELQREAMETVRSSGLPQRIEEYSGGAVFATTIRPVFEADILTGFVIVTRDISAQRRSEVGLAESEKRYRSVYEAARDAIIMLDRDDGAVLDCNAAAPRLYGYTAEEMLKLSISDLSEDPERALESIRSGLEHVPLRYHKRKSGISFPVEVSMSHFIHDGREVCTAYVHDISQHKLVEEALREGARLYRAVVEDQTELICRYNPDRKLSFVNGAFARFFGVDEDDIIGQEFFPDLAGDERRDLKSWLGEAGPGNPVFDREQHVQRADGEARWVLWTNRAILDYLGEVMEIQAVGRDITQQKEAEQALGKSEVEKERYRQNLEATFRSIPDAIITVDSLGRVIATNSAAEPLLSVSREQASGRDFQDVVDDSGNPCLSVLKEVLKSNRSVRGYEAKLDLPTLGERMVELNCTPLLDQTKEHTGAVLVVRDVSRIVDLEKRLHERHGFRGIVGRSTQMQEIYKLLEQLSSLDSIVLILGESGTGKELVAEALHYGGSRASKPLIKVNCSALSESLLESELFGHVRGAFTGAVRDKVGRIQAAQGGTLFLDEIGDISPLIQLKLLRFLENKEYERVGESKTQTADVRIIAATNANMLQAVKMGTFREDLYYRLNVMPVLLPPLRERQADIPLLVDHFLEIFSGQFGKTFSSISNEVTDLFMTYGWPGNVRELRHILEHACILSPGNEIALNHMRPDLVEQMRVSGFVQPTAAPPMGAVLAGGYYVPGTMPPPVGYGQPAGYPVAPQVAPQPGYGEPAPYYPSRPKVDKQDVLEALNRCGGNKAKAARQLGIHRATLYRKLRAWDMED